MNIVASTTSLPWDVEPYSIKRHGAAINNCDSEPIRTPGCIQAHGALLVVRGFDRTILQASENTQAVLGHSPGLLLGQSVSIAIGESGEALLKDLMARESTDRNPLYVFTLPAQDNIPPLDVTVHTVGGFAVIEFEPQIQPEIIELDYYALVKRTVARLQTAESLQEFCDFVAEEVRTLTGLDRVMVYRFHADAHGEVFAESKKTGLSSWVGLHYPAEDIPKPARDIFTRVWVRPTPDVSGGLAELVPLLNPDTGLQLDMTHCALRGASLMYTEYLKNMQVTAGLTMPIRQEDQLWGLIACHHYEGAKPFSYQLRAACEFLAQVVSLQLKGAEDREFLVYRMNLEGMHQQLVAAAAQAGGLAPLTDGPLTLLSGMNATGAAVYHSDRWWRVGDTPSEVELNALTAWLFERREFQHSSRPLYVTEFLSLDYPAGKQIADVASGVLAVALSQSRRNIMIWFRPELIRTVNWGGNPEDKPTVLGPNGPRLTPRRSFELFAESVRLQSHPWKPVEIESVIRLRRFVMELVVGRAERLADLNVDLIRSNEELDAFACIASHDLKEPLRGIHKYAHQLLEGAASLDAENRRRLDSLMRLTLRMDSLLDSLFHFSRVGQTTLSFEETDFNEILAEAIEMVNARRTDGATEIVTPRPLPIAPCDPLRLREIFVNLLSNALKYNDKAGKRIEVGYIAPGVDPAPYGCPSREARHVIYYVRDNGIGIDPKHFGQVFKMFNRLHGRDEFGGGTGAGLTIVKKLVERHRGEVWLESAVGVGTTVYFTLPCREETQATVAVPLPRIIIVGASNESFNAVQTAINVLGSVANVLRTSGAECLSLLRGTSTARTVVVLMDEGAVDSAVRKTLIAIHADSTLKTCPVLVFCAADEHMTESSSSVIETQLDDPTSVQYPNQRHILVELLGHWLTKTAMPIGQARS